MKRSLLIVASPLLSLCLPFAVKAEATATLRYPAPSAATLRTVTWSGSRFVAAGENGVILTSATGGAWQLQNAPVVRRWLCSASGGGRTMLGGERGTLLESTDGLSWNVVAIPVDPEHPGIEGLIRIENGIYASGRFLFSGDSLSRVWVSSTPGQSTMVTGAYASGGFAAGPSDAVASGVEQFLHFTGTGWTPVPRDPSSPFISRITWTGTRYIGLSGTDVEPSSAIHTSPDGITWTPCISGVSTPLREILWAGTQAVVVGDDGVILTSPDGTVWTKRESGTTRNLTAAAWSGTTLAVVGGAGVILTSPDGAAWTKQNETEPSLAVGDLTWLSTGGYAFASSENPVGTLRSADGLTWTRTAASNSPLAPIPGLGSNAARLVAAAANGSRVVVSSGSGLWQGPADGSSWTRVGPATYGVVWDGQRFMTRFYYGSNPEIGLCDTEGGGTSVDGVNWSGLREAVCPLVITDGSLPYDNLVWTGQRYVRRDFSSADGASWQRVTGFQGGFITFYLVWTGTEVLAVATNGQVCSSSAGEDWTRITPPQWDPQNNPTDPVNLLPPVWTGSQLLAAEGYPRFGGIYAWAHAGGWRKVSDISARSLAWTGSSLLVNALYGIYTLENLPVPLTWTAWKAIHFPGADDPAIIGPEADPDGDGWRNLIEYATGSLPASRVSQPSARLVTIYGTPAFEWSTETAVSGVVLKAQATGDLITWNDVDVNIVRTEGTVVTRWVGATTPGRYFFRLAATLQN